MAIDLYVPTIDEIKIVFPWVKSYFYGVKSYFHRLNRDISISLSLLFLRVLFTFTKVIHYRISNIVATFLSLLLCTIYKNRILLPIDGA